MWGCVEAKNVGRAQIPVFLTPGQECSGPLPPEVFQGASLEHILRGFELLWRAWQKCGAARPGSPAPAAGIRLP